MPNETKIITSEQAQEAQTVEFELIENSQEVTPAEPVAEPAQTQAIDNNAMLAIMQKMEEKQAQQAEEFNLKLAEQQELIESLAKEKEVLKAQAVKVIDPVEMEKRLKEAKVCEARQSYLQQRLDDVATCKRHPNDTFVNLTNEYHDIVFPFNNSVFVGELLDKMHEALQKEYDEKSQEIKSLMTF
jgi:hypothetical protein